MKKHNYAEVINKATYRLSCDADNKRAGQILQKTYSEALVYYQNEIDRILLSNDKFRWAKTLDIMQKTNDLSDEIRYNSTASRLICEPKIYASEIPDITQRAVAELYGIGTDLLTQNTKEKAKEAYYYFTKAEKLIPKYKDVGEKIHESKERATFKVIIEPVSAYTQNNVLSFSTKTFYQTMFYKLRENFPYSGFISFYSPEEASNHKITNPDQIVQIEIYDFELESKIIEYGGEVIPNPSKILTLVDGKYVWVKYVGPPNNRISNQKTLSRLLMKANAVLKITSPSDHKTVYKDNIPWNYTEELNYSYKSGISQTHISISPDNQIFFDHFSLSLGDQVVNRLSQFFKQYN
ncbi:MAG: hypothetical protein Q8N05_06950 [Bacteroidota bacterium]|nr:hypothetical protein [Bacteroidota bacterium]